MHVFLQQLRKKVNVRGPLQIHFIVLLSDSHEWVYPLELVKLGGSMVQRISLSSIQHVSSTSGKTNLFIGPLGA